MHVITGGGGVPRHGYDVCVRPGVGCAEATYALPRPRAAPAPGQDSASLPHRSFVKGGTYYPEGSLFSD